MMEKSVFSIELKSISVTGPADHYFWQLNEYRYDSSGNYVGGIRHSEIHGFGTTFSSPDLTKANLATLGTNEDLFVYEGSPETFDSIGLKSDTGYSKTYSTSGMVNTGSYESAEFLRQWYGAVDDAAATINQNDARYHLLTQNSNSVARAVGEVLSNVFGFDLPAYNPLPGDGGRFGPGWGNKLDNPTTEATVPRGRLMPLFCFSAGTFISMADGTQKPIELITPDDTVMSFNPAAEDGRGALVPGKVVRLFRNHAPHMLDFHGTRVTPGHAYLCGDGPYEGRFRPLIDILRDDGAVVKADGTLMRAATGCTVGARGDAFVDLEVLRIGHDRRTGAEVRHVEARGLVRAGTTLTDERGLSYTLLGLLDAKGWKLQPDGRIVQAPGREPAPLRSLLPALPKPEDYVLARSGLTLADVYDDPRQDERPAMPVVRGDASGASAEPGVLHATAPWLDTARAAGSASTVSGPSRKARRKAEAEQRKQGRLGTQARATLH